MKAKFLTAYIYLYGGTKKHAENVYKTASAAYIAAVIDSYYQDCKLGFYND